MKKRSIKEISMRPSFSRIISRISLMALCVSLLYPFTLLEAREQVKTKADKLKFDSISASLNSPSSKFFDSTKTDQAKHQDSDSQQDAINYSDIIDQNTLSLPYRKLTSLTGISNHLELEELDLSNNEFGDSTTSLKGLSNLVNLKKLDLSKNKLNSINEIVALNKLENLNLRANNIESLQGISKLVNLKLLNIYENKLASLEGLSKLSEYKKNSLSKKIEVKYDSESYLNRLQQLLAGKNQITTLEHFPELPELWMLDLSQNRITSLKYLPQLPNLHVLNLSDNQIASFKDQEVDVLGRLQSLRDLDLSNNQISSLEGFSILTENNIKLFNEENKSEKKLHLSELICLNLRNNCLNSLKWLPDLPKLEKLYLDGNNLVSLDELVKFDALEVLTLSENEELSAEELSKLKLPNLKKLTIGKILPNSLPMSELKNLQRIDFSFKIDSPNEREDFIKEIVKFSEMFPNCNIYVPSSESFPHSNRIRIKNGFKHKI